jgi:3-oxoacyl-[acyl-carrier-protein] synthase II
MSNRRVVITGLGCVTTLGETADTLFDALCKSQSGISAIESFDSSQYSVHFGGEIKSFRADQYIEFHEAKRMDRFTQMAFASAVIAVKNSGLDFEKEDKSRAAVVVGTGIGGLKEIEEQHIRLLEKGPRKVSPFCVPKLMANAASGCISIHYGLQGSNFCIVTACASAGHAIGEAFYNILNDRSDIAITGGSEAALTPIGLASFCALKSLSTRNDNPQKASRPFDKDRDGFVLSEGAGIYWKSMSTPENEGQRYTPKCWAMAQPATGIILPPPCPTAQAEHKRCDWPSNRLELTWNRLITSMHMVPVPS